MWCSHMSTGGRSGRMTLRNRSTRRPNGPLTSSGIFPNERANIRHVGSLQAEQHDDRAVARRYYSAESLAKLTANGSPDPLPAPVLLKNAA